MKFNYILFRIKRKIIKIILSPLKLVSPHTYTSAFRFVTGYNNQLDALVKLNTSRINDLCQTSHKRLFVDCGVNEGFVLSRYIGELKNFRFTGFEIQSELIPVAQQKNPSAQIHHAAVSAQNGQSEIYLPKGYGTNYRGGASTIRKKVSDKKLHERRFVTSIKLSEYLRAQKLDEKFDFIAVKMDIEGAEYGIIDDLYNLWTSKSETLIDYLIIEFHPSVLDDKHQHELYLKKLDKMGLEFSTWI